PDAQGHRRIPGTQALPRDRIRRRRLLHPRTYQRTRPRLPLFRTGRGEERRSVVLGRHRARPARGGIHRMGRPPAGYDAGARPDLIPATATVLSRPPPSPAPDRRSRRMPATRSRFLLASLLVALLAGLVFLPGLPGEFVFDDIPNITNNEVVHLERLDADGLTKVLTTPQ